MSNRYVKVDPARMQTARIIRGLTLEELAEETGFTAGALSMIETGKTRRPSPLMVKELMAALGPEILVPEVI